MAGNVLVRLAAREDTTPPAARRLCSAAAPRALCLALGLARGGGARRASTVVEAVPVPSRGDVLA